MTLARNIGRTIREIRDEKGFTQEQFADSVKINRVYMGVIERGEASFTIKTLSKVAKGLGMPVWSILKSAEERTKE